ncbi:hypothetical protein [Treponema endosymbiont of Eucomonympha sp.]|nr:hypothetical protein [Treponema endosymbiont of Eucomonympha sp.]
MKYPSASCGIFIEIVFGTLKHLRGIDTCYAKFTVAIHRCFSFTSTFHTI